MSDHHDRDGRIADGDITFVVQGPVLADGLTAEAIASVHRHFPESPVVFSTWEAEDVASLSADEVVRSADPGPVRDRTKRGHKNNVNRQIVSNRAGLARAQTRFAAKLRSDALVTGRGFVGLADAFPHRSPEGRLFERRIAISRDFTRSPRALVPLAFHPSDMFQFGLASDLRSFWSVPLIEGEGLRDFVLDEMPRTWFRMFERFRFTTEQYLFVQNARRADYAADFDHFARLDPSTAWESEFLLFNNFIPCEPEILGVSHHRFDRRMHRALSADCVGLREFLSWYAAEAIEAPVESAIGPPVAQIPFALRAERHAREFLKRSPALRALYAGRFLDR